jgi:hypothetical protein
MTCLLSFCHDSVLQSGKETTYINFSYVCFWTILLTSINYSFGVLFIVSILPPRRLSSSAVTISWRVPFQCSWISLKDYSKGKFKSSGFKASPCSRPFWIGKLWDKCLPIRTLLCVSFEHILISLTNLIRTLNFMRMLYNTSLLTEP